MRDIGRGFDLLAVQGRALSSVEIRKFGRKPRHCFRAAACADLCAAAGKREIVLAPQSGVGFVGNMKPMGMVAHRRQEVDSAAALEGKAGRK